jgi:hypothetical protein
VLVKYYFSPQLSVLQTRIYTFFSQLLLLDFSIEGSNTNILKYYQCGSTDIKGKIQTENMIYLIICCFKLFG